MFPLFEVESLRGKSLPEMVLLGWVLLEDGSPAEAPVGLVPLGGGLMSMVPVEGDLRVGDPCWRWSLWV